MAAADPAEPDAAGLRGGLAQSDWRFGVWRLFLQRHNSVLRQLERDLSREADLPLTWYDVLLQLAEARGRRLRMAELAELTLLSRSGLTRLVDRISAAGLVLREPYPGDARGTYCVLTEQGLARLRGAAPIHLAGVERYWLSRLNDVELVELRGLLTRLGDEHEPEHEPGHGHNS